MTKIFIIAGEASGDALGSKLIKALKSLQPNIEIYGVGGAKMEQENFKSIFPMHEISLIGFAEIIPHLPKLLSRLKLTENKIREINPDAIITIDSPGFNYRFVKDLQDLRGKIKFIHYVAPSVWAYKPERATKTAKLFDHLLVIFPFEPQYFEKEGLAATYIGHPIFEDGLPNGDAAAFKKRHNIDDFICIMPGSRFGELKRNLPILKEAAENLGYPIVIIAADNVRSYLEKNTADWKVQTLIVDNSEKADCFAAAKAGIIKSGTSSLEFAVSNKPYVTVYKLSNLSAFIIKRMIKISHVNLLNIVASREIIKELIQNKFTAENVVKEMKSLLKSPQNADYTNELAKLQTASKPSLEAAKTILSVIEHK